MLTLSHTAETNARIATEYDYGDQPFPDDHLLAPGNYRDDLDAYPRAHTPPWLSAYVTGGRKPRLRIPSGTPGRRRANRGSGTIRGTSTATCTATQSSGPRHHGGWEAPARRPPSDHLRQEVDRARRSGVGQLFGDPDRREALHVPHLLHQQVGIPGGAISVLRGAEDLGAHLEREPRGGAAGGVGLPGEPARHHLEPRLLDDLVSRVGRGETVTVGGSIQVTRDGIACAKPRFSLPWTALSPVRVSSGLILIHQTGAAKPLLRVPLSHPNAVLIPDLFTALT